MVRSIKQELEDINLKNYEMPIDQFNGLQLELAAVCPHYPF